MWKLEFFKVQNIRIHGKKRKTPQKPTNQQNNKTPKPNSKPNQNKTKQNPKSKSYKNSTAG